MVAAIISVAAASPGNRDVLAIGSGCFDRDNVADDLQVNLKGAMNVARYKHNEVTERRNHALQRELLIAGSARE
ncbi:hypothetical protein [Bradyrhizobium sp. USDA 4353]